ncbi:MAG: extracellular solute-binding protein [Thermomicrobiales bacterium]
MGQHDPTALTRRSLLKTAAAGAALAATPVAASASPARPAAPTLLRRQNVDQLTVVINSSPWMEGFRHMAEVYSEQSGVKVELAAFPFEEVFPKERDAVLNETDEFDIYTLGESWVAFFYAGGFVRPINELDPDFAFDENVIQYSNLARWNADKKYFTEDGQIMGVPQSGIVQLLFYRRDLYEEAGLPLPETWDDVENAAKELTDKDEPFYGFVNRGAKGDPIAWDWLAHYHGYAEGNVAYFKNPPDDWTPTLNNDAGMLALEQYIRLSEYAPENVGVINQADQINLMGGDNALATVAAASARAAVDDEEQSAVVGKVDFAVVPKPANGRHAAMSGGFAAGIPKHIPEERQIAAMEFLKWTMTLEAQVEYLKGGGVPVRTDAYTSPEADDPQFRFAQAMVDSTPFIHPFFRMPEGPEIRDRLGLRLNQALIGELEPQEALATAEEDAFEILRNAGYNV